MKNNNCCSRIKLNNAGFEKKLAVFLHIVIAVSFSALLMACDKGDRYEISKDATGKTVRLDKKTGEIAIIDGDQIKSLKEVASLEKERGMQKKAEEERKASLAKSKIWDPTDIVQFGLRASLYTSWQEGKMYYDFRLFDLEQIKEYLEVLKNWDPKKDKDIPESKLDKKKKQVRIMGGFNHRPYRIQFMDENGFKINEIHVTELIRVVDDKDQLNYLQYQGSEVMTADTYQRLSTMTVGWSGR